MQNNGFLEIIHEFVERFALRNGRQVNTFGDIVLFAFIYMGLDSLFHESNLIHQSKEVNRRGMVAKG